MPIAVKLGISAAMLLPGLLLIYLGWRNRQRAALSLQWPTAEGQITSSSIRVWKDRESGDQYEPKVEYGYAVNGEIFSGNRIAFGSSSTRSRVAAQQVLDSYPVGEMVPVYYDPARPKESVLTQKAASIMTYYLVGAALIIAAVVLFIAF